MTFLPAADARVLAQLDFEPTEIPCAITSHADHPHQEPHPAAWWCRAECPACHAPISGPVCDEWRLRFLGADVVACAACGRRLTPAEFGPTFTPIRRQS